MVSLLIEEIKKLKEEKNAIILAHNYQIPEIQEVADIVGDSFKLSQEAERAKEDLVILSGVHFMAESVKILSPKKRVLLPARDAGCPMADMVDVEKLKELKSKYPGVPVVSYVNTSAEVKAESDICCTSSNAVKIVKSINSDKIIFAPDKNLGHYIAKQVPNKELILWDGFCIVHHRVLHNDIDEIRNLHPEAQLLVHPECRPEVQEKADFLGSTSQIIEFANNSKAKTFIIGTEVGVLHAMEKMNPNKKFYLLSPGLVCSNMKKTSLIDVRNALLNEENEIFVDEDIRYRAEKSLKKMLEMS